MSRKEAVDRRLTQQSNFLGPVLVSARVVEFVLFVAALVAGCLLPSALWWIV